MSKITDHDIKKFIDDCAMNRPKLEDVQGIVKFYGIAPAKNANELKQKLYAIVDRHKADAVKKLSHCHPAAPIFKSIAEEELTDFKNACGCMFNADGEPIGRMPEVENKTVPAGSQAAKSAAAKNLADTGFQNNLLIIGAVVILSVAILAMTRSK